MSSIDTQDQYSQKVCNHELGVNLLTSHGIYKNTYTKRGKDAPILDVRMAGTSAAASFNTLHKIMYLMQFTLCALAFDWSYASNA